MNQTADGIEVDASHEGSGGPQVLHLPSVGKFARHAVPSLLEGAIGPMVVFYVILIFFGFRGALFAAVAWSCLAAGRRVARRERLPAFLLLGLVLLAARTLIAYTTGSAFLYFLQPTLGTFLVGLLFAASALVRRPLIERLASEFCPLDGELMARPFMRRFFLQLSLLWGAVMTVNAGLVLFLLVESSLRAFVVERTIVSYTLTFAGILVSTAWFVRSMKGAGIAVHFGKRRVVAAERAAA